MEEDFKALLTAADGGAYPLLAAATVNWFEHPQGQPLPCVVLHKVSGAEPYAQDGRTGLVQARVQVDVWADAGPSDALLLAREIEALLSGYRGAVSGGLGRFQGIFLTSTRSGREGGSNEAERPFRQTMDFDVNWRATS